MMLLETPWVFWALPKNKRVNIAYEKVIKRIGRVSTVEEFWDVYCRIIRPGDNPTNCDFVIFREGIKPVWEDPANAQGGKHMARLKKGGASRAWEDLCMTLVGEQMCSDSSQVCGAVLSIRHNEDIVSVWTRDGSKAEAEAEVRSALKTKLRMADGVVVEYKAHSTSRQDNYSYRNTSKDSNPWGSLPTSPTS